MLKKTKLFQIVIILIILFASIILIQSLISLEQNNKKVINKSIDIAYKEKEKELQNYVALAYKTIESYYARTAKEKIKGEVKYYIEEQTEYLFSIINSEYERNKDLISEEELKKRIISIIKSTRYGKSGYFWINDFNYKMIMHPIKEDLTGVIFKNRKDSPFVELSIKELNKTNKDKAFIEYSFYNPRSEKKVYKSSIVKVFKPYNWILGTGAYIDDITESMKKEALKAIFQMKYGETGYFWIIDSNHKLLMDGGSGTFPYESKYEVKNTKGVHLYRKIVEVANNNKDGGFLKYFWTIPLKDGEFEKLSFVKKFEAWDFIIGTGIYIEDIEKNTTSINEEIENNLFSVLKVALLFIMMMYLIITLLVNIQKRNKIEVKLKNKTLELDSLNKTLEIKVSNRTIEIEGQKIVLQSIIDSQKSMLIVTDFKDISFVNQSFLDFFDLKNKELFKDRFDSLVDVFCEYGDYIHKGKIDALPEKYSLGRNFYNLIRSTRDDKKIVVILDRKLEAKSFYINITIIDKEKDLYLVSLTDITKITIEKVIAEQKAYIDGLTGVANRNQFNIVFEKELIRAKRYDTTFSIAILDIDHFKNFNDNYGHLIGDEVLIILAQKCVESIRTSDFFARWGGEEFVLLCPQTKLDEAVSLANKLRKTIESLEHKTAGVVTCSFGVTEYRDSDDLNSLFKRCDEALYTAKEKGRNRVESI